VCLLVSRLIDSSVFGIAAFDSRVYSGIPALLASIMTVAAREE
jgi:hypothetical protein